MGARSRGGGEKRTDTRVPWRRVHAIWSEFPTKASRRFHSSNSLLARGHEESIGGSNPLSLPSFVSSDKFHGPKRERGHRREGRARADDGANSGEVGPNLRFKGKVSCFLGRTFDSGASPLIHTQFRQINPS